MISCKNGIFFLSTAFFGEKIYAKYDKGNQNKNIILKINRKYFEHPTWNSVRLSVLIYLSLFLYLCVTVYPYFLLSRSSFQYISVYLSTLSVSVSYIYLSNLTSYCLSLHLAISLSIYLSFDLSTYLSI